MALAAYVNHRLVMFRRVLDRPAVTATPDSVRLPASGSVVILTASRLLAPAVLAASVGSVKPKSAAEIGRASCRDRVKVLAVRGGASFNEVTARDMVLTDGCRST